MSDIIWTQMRPIFYLLYANTLIQGIKGMAELTNNENNIPPWYTIPFKIQIERQIWITVQIQMQIEKEVEIQIQR